MGSIQRRIRAEKEIARFRHDLAYLDRILQFWACDLGWRCPECRLIARTTAHSDLPRRK